MDLAITTPATTKTVQLAPAPVLMTLLLDLLFSGVMMGKPRPRSDKEETVTTFQIMPAIVHVLI